MSESTLSEPVVIDVRPIPKPQRHPLIFDALEDLAVGQSVVIQNDHNPLPLRAQVEAIFGAQFVWHYLEAGPEVFRLQFTRRVPAPAGWKRTEFQSTLPLAPIQSTLSAPPAPVQAAAIRVDLLECLRQVSHSGPQWAHECDDLDLTLLSWQSGKRIEAHVNNEVDVIWMGVAGEGVAVVNGQKHELRPGVVLLIPKGCERAVESASERFSYLSVHRRRRGLMPTLNGKLLS